MAYLVLVLALSFNFFLLPARGADKILNYGKLGERDPSLYAGPLRPVFSVDPYFGTIRWQEEEFNQQYLFHYVWRGASDYGRMLEDMIGASTCSDEQLSESFNDIRYGFRLLALSLLMEQADSISHTMALMKQPQSCSFNAEEWLKTCRPNSADMKGYVETIQQQKLFMTTPVDKSHNFANYVSQWQKGILQNKPTSPSQWRVLIQCQAENKNCSNFPISELGPILQRACQQDKALFTKVCSEEDHLYGLSQAPTAYYLLSTSNLINLFNQVGQGKGCLRRFLQLMSKHERVYSTLNQMLPVLSAYVKELKPAVQPQGRTFVFGALKEFTQKGLAQVFEPTKPLPEPVKPTIAAAQKPVQNKPAENTAVSTVSKPITPVVTQVEKTKEVVEIAKSAFLMASELRKSDELDRVEVDMLKLRYDYVFSLGELQILGDSLKDYISRQALEEMRSFDKLGDKEGAVPLRFIKFMIDADQHQGLYNMVSVLGQKFWIDNDIDASFKPRPEYVELRNDETTGHSWQLTILKP